ncbi:MAG: hypothetical protein KC496_01365, partial [Anaerolineae bacterium]|nr:hypothetical protein [Anaerolineae bacterium]
MVLLFLTLSIGITSAQSGNVILQLAVPIIGEDFLESSIATYEAEHPGVQVQLVTYQGFGSPVQSNDDAEAYQDDLAEYAQSADVLLVDENLSPEATRGDYFLDLSPLTQSDPNYNPNDFRANLAYAFNWDGGQWAIPVSMDAVMLTYLPAAFDAAGLTYPNESWTLDDLIFAAETLTQYDSTGEVTLPGLWVQGGSGGTMMQRLMVSLLGQGVYSDATIPSSPDYSNPALANLLDQWQAFEDEGLMTIPSDADSSQIPLRIGNAVFGAQVIQFSEDGELLNSEDFAETYALLPGGHAGIEVNAYAISKGTAYPRESYDLIMSLIQDPNAITLSGGANPALASATTMLDSVLGGGGRAGGRAGGGRGGVVSLTSLLGLSDEMLETALMNGLLPSDMRFASGINDALDSMSSDGLDAQTALDTAASDLQARLVVADTHAATPITVNAPEVERALAANEIALNFGIVQGIGGFSGPGAEAIWEQLGEEFVAQDAEVGRITVSSPNIASG